MASFTKVRVLRVGEGGFTADTADLVDEYLVTVSEQIDKFAFLNLWVAHGGLPIPKHSFRSLGTSFVVCDRISAQVKDSQRYIWQAAAHWKAIENSQTQDQTRPVPTSNSTDPTDWRPKVTRRPVTIIQPAESLFYKAGYGGALDVQYRANTAAGTRSPFTNSAANPFRDQLPPHQRIQNLWTIRWVRPSVPNDLVESELTLNENTVTFTHRGYSEVWEEQTALIESVQLTETQWGNQQLWEIAVEIRHDRNGHAINALDQGFMEMYYPGEPLPSGGSALERTLVAVKDKDNLPVSEPVMLDGNGKRLSEPPEVYGVWRDFELSSFNTLTLLEDMVS